MSEKVEPISYCQESHTLRLLDQRKLPTSEEYMSCSSPEQVAEAIRSMVVRGAPAIGITAAYGLAIAQKNGEDMGEAYQVLASSRPTAVNLRWALDKIKDEVDMETAAKIIH